MNNGLEIRWHGRGGQGAKTAALLLADVAFKTGKYVQGFLNTGQNVWEHQITAYNRISEYDQTGEKNVIVPMNDFWKTAPSGGEFTSSLSMEEMLDTNLSGTVEMLREAHTTFLGPKIPDENYVDGYKEVLKNMGYRLWISMAELKNTAKGSRLKLTWENSGVAPMYKEWPVYVYIEDESGKLVEKSRISIKISSLLPGEKATTLTALETERLNSLLEKGYRLSVGIEDPMTELPCVRFAMEALYQEGKNYLW